MALCSALSFPSINLWLIIQSTFFSTTYIVFFGCLSPFVSIQRRREKGRQGKGGGSCGHQAVIETKGDLDVQDQFLRSLTSSQSKTHTNLSVPQWYLPSHSFSNSGVTCLVLLKRDYMKSNGSSRQLRWCEEQLAQPLTLLECTFLTKVNGQPCEKILTSSVSSKKEKKRKVEHSRSTTSLLLYFLSLLRSLNL